MKRGLVFSLCALVALAAGASAQAQNVQLSLNLRYTDPFDPSEGGSWYLVAKTDDPDGIAGISAYINNINTAGMSYGNTNAVDTRYGTPGTVTATTLAAILNGGQPYNTTIGGAVNVVYGQDLAGGPIVADVGQGSGTPGNVASDPLKNAAWNNAAIIANGTFGATRPTIATNVGSASNNTDANTLQGTTLGQAGTDAATTITVRGDSVFSLGLNTPGNAGLRQGDANRDFTVTGADFAILQNNFNQAPGTKGWDQGDFNDDGNVSGADFALLQNNFGQPAVSPQIASVPEPASIMLMLAGAGVAIGLARKRS